MALIKDAKGRRDNETPSGYERLFGNSQLGKLISKVQSAVISTGNELENVIASKIIDPKGVSIQNINKEKRIFEGVKQGHKIVIDCVIEKDNKICLIEIKDGDTFDTKKVAGELESLKLVKQYLIKKGLLEKNIEIKFCSFNAINHEQIEKGAKGLLDKSMAMTGKELCELLGLDFNKIVEERKINQKENLEYLKQEMKKIKELN